MNRPQLIVHGHFYQPLRLDPFSGELPADPTAAPAHDWNELISADCYRPNAELGNLGAISWDLGPTLAGWLHETDPVAHDGFVAGDHGTNGMAQPFHHTILPLASAADRRTEIRWGLRDFLVRFGRPATGMWLPETAVDLATLRLLADEGVTYTILAPWQVTGHDIDTRRPVRIELGDGRTMAVALYDGGLSAAVSFDPHATTDADRFIRASLRPRFVDDPLPDGERPVVLIATDGELYGHHQPLREHFLRRLVGATAPSPEERGYDVVPLATAMFDRNADTARVGVLRDRTSWSCHHGIARWGTHCDCVDDGHWKAPLRSALDRLAGAIDALTERTAREIGAADPWTARDDYVDVVIGLETATAFSTRRLGDADDARIARFTALMEAQRWRLAMYASCGWFWDDPIRPETAGVLRAATRAARLIDGLAGTGIERRLAADLELAIGPGGHSGEAIRRVALGAVGQVARG